MEPNDFKELVKKNRSYRRFYEDQRIEEQTLLELIDAARLISSVFNRQGMRYRLVYDAAECEVVFPTLGWAALYKDWDGPTVGERPTAYVICLRDRAVSRSIHFDDGIAVQTITLYAAAMGIGGCILQNCDSRAIFQSLNIDPTKYTFSCIIALGYPAEKVVLEETTGDDMTYWKTPDDVHHVPKRTLENVIVK